MNWLQTNLEPVPSYLHAGGTIIRKGNKLSHYRINNNFHKINLAFQADLGKSAEKNLSHL